MEQLYPGRAGLNIVAATRMRGRLAVPVVAAALAEIARRHAAWRTTFPSVGGSPVQRVAAGGGPRLALIDLAGLPAARREAEAALPGRRGLGRAFRSRARAAGPREPAPPGRGGARLPAHDPPPGDRLHLLPDRLGGAGGALRRAVGRPPGALPEPPVQYPDFARLAARLAAGGGAGGAGLLVARAAGRLPAGARAADRPAAPGGGAHARRAAARRRPPRARRGAARPRPRGGGDPLHDRARGHRRAALPRLRPGAADPRRQQRQPQPAGDRRRARLLPHPGAVPDRPDGRSELPRAAGAGPPVGARRLRPPGPAVRQAGRGGAAGARPQPPAAGPGAGPGARRPDLRARRSPASASRRSTPTTATPVTT